MNLSRNLAEFVAGLRYEDLPAGVAENQKKSVMDAVAITYGAGALGDGCKTMVELASDMAAGGEGQATVIGFDRKLPAVQAAFANAAMAHSLDFGDTHQMSTMHSNSASFPAALAVAEMLGGVSGRELLTALVAGSEVTIRLALAADVNTTDYGFYPPAIFSSFGATAAAGKLLGLTAEQLIAAFSFNLTQAMCSGELVNNAKTVVRSVREAFSARNAVTSCLMAKRELAGFDDPFEGKLGFYHTFLRDQYTPERALSGLGEVFEAEKLTYKAWPCCFGTHGALTALRGMLDEGLFTENDVRHIQVSVGAQNRILFEPLSERRNPETAIVGKFSIPYTLGCLLHTGTVDLGSFSPEKLHDPAIRALAARVDYTYMDAWQRGKETYTNVVVETQRGTFERFVADPFGTEKNPMDDRAFDEKFLSCARFAVCGRTDEQLGQIKNAIRGLDAMEDIRALTALL